MKYTYSLLICLFAFAKAGKTQELTGYWRGWLVKGTGLKEKRAKFEIKFVKDGDSLAGTSYYFSDGGHYIRYSVRGVFDPSTGYVRWWDYKLLGTMPVKVEALDTSYRPLVSRARFGYGSPGSITLEGTSEMGEELRLNLFLEKKEKTLFKDEWDPLIKDVAAGKNNRALKDSVWAISEAKAQYNEDASRAAYALASSGKSLAGVNAKQPGDKEPNAFNPSDGNAVASASIPPPVTVPKVQEPEKPVAKTPEPPIVVANNDNENAAAKAAEAQKAAEKAALEEEERKAIAKADAERKALEKARLDSLAIAKAEAEKVARAEEEERKATARLAEEKRLAAKAEADKKAKQEEDKRKLAKAIENRRRLDSVAAAKTAAQTAALKAATAPKVVAPAAATTPAAGTVVKSVNTNTVPTANLPIETGAIQEKFIARKKIEQGQIPMSGDTLELNFYDNGTIDGDSISLFVNGKLVFEHVLLKSTAFTFKLAVKDLPDGSELAMVAENLGSIPPNTAYMTATVEGDRYDIRLESTLSSSGIVRLIRR